MSSVLVADDDPYSRTLVQSILDDAGYSVTCACDSTEAFEAFERERPQCVLLSARKSGLDGLTVCERIRASACGRDTALLVFLDRQELSTFEDALAAGADDCVTKPVQACELLARVRCAVLRSSNALAERLANALASIPDAWALFDAQRRLVANNATWRAYAGTSDPGIGRPYEELVNSVFGRVGAGSQPSTPLTAAARTIDTQDGRVLRWIERETADGGRLLLVSDVTVEQRNTQALREACAAAQRESRAKSELVSTASHELRNPLGAILGFAQLLQRDKQRVLPERSKQYVDQIVKGTEQLDRMLDQLLELSRIETGRTPMATQRLRLDAVLSETADALAPLATPHDVRVEQHTPSQSVEIVADRQRLVQILRSFGCHLLAQQPASQVLRFAASLANPQRVRIAVHTQKAGTFDPSQSAQTLTHEDAEAQARPQALTEIGFAVAGRLADMMGGRIGRERTDEHGVGLWIELPAQLP